MTADRVPFLWLCGADGVGKSSVGWEIHCQLAASGVKNAYVDFDQVGFCRPASDDDPDNHRLKALNLGAMWPSFRIAGARCLVASGVVDSRATVRWYANAVPGLTLTLCRLRAGHEELRARIFERGRGGGPPIPGDEVKGQPYDHLRRLAAQAARYADQLARDNVGDVCVDTDGRSVGEVALLVLARTGGWPHLA